MHEPGLPGVGAAAGHGEAEDAESGAGGRAGEARGPPAAPSLATDLAHREQSLQVTTLATNPREVPQCSRGLLLVGPTRCLLRAL